MVTLLNFRLTIGDDNVVTTNDSADSCARWQLDFFDSTSDDFRCAFVAVRDGFDGLSNATA